MKMVKKRMRGKKQEGRSTPAENYKLIIINAGASPEFEGLKTAIDIRKYHTS